MSRTLYTISLEGMEFFGHHGVLPHEKEVGGRYSVDVWINLSRCDGAITDNLSETLDYGLVYNTVAAEMAIPSRLIEHAAHRIAEKVSKLHPYTSSIKVCLKKYAPPIGGNCTFTSITLEKTLL